MTPFRCGTAGFRGRIRTRQLGQCSILQLEADPHSVKVKLDTSKDSNKAHYYAVKLVQTGTGVMIQNGKTVVLKSGDICLGDYSHPFEECFEESFTMSSFKIPSEMLTPRLVRPMKSPTIHISVEDELNPLIRSFILELTRLPDDQYDKHAITLIETLCSLLSVALEAKARNSLVDDHSLNQIRLLSVKNYVCQNLSNPDLTPSTVADACGISVRYLHKLFKPQGETFGRWLLRQRLDRCRQQIADPRFLGKSLSKISYDWGFNNFSHFGRAFRSEYGMCPRDYRKNPQPGE